MSKTPTEWQENYREELIQIAAVTLAILQDLDTGTTKLDNIKFTELTQEVYKERARQVAKFGAQHREAFTWMTILGEEYGEACQAALKVEFGNAG